MDTVSITPHELHRLLGSAAAPLVVDVRRDKAYEADPHLVASATRATGDLVEFARAPGARAGIVAYCVHGHEVSQEAARALAAAGLDARYLEGGIEAWRGAGLPTIKRRPDWKVPGGSRWITRERPKIDRVACPWLIRRFIDPVARFDYVPASRVFDEAGKRGAVPYDIAGAPVTHRGERCSFDALIEDFALEEAALARLATIVRGADTDRHDLAPQCESLVAASMELSRRFADDHEMLAHAMPVYDSLYAWCRAAAGDKERPWNPPR
jgi:rhodanese-related sulfurtransferase